MSAEPEALVKNAADEEQVARGEWKEKDVARRRSAVFRVVLEAVEGREALMDLLDFCSPFATIYDENPHRTAYNAGKQDVGHWIVRQIELADPDAMLTMMREKKARTTPETTPRRGRRAPKSKEIANG